MQGNVTFPKNSWLTHLSIVSNSGTFTSDAFFQVNPVLPIRQGEKDTQGGVSLKFGSFAVSIATAGKKARA